MRPSGHRRHPAGWGYFAPPRRTAAGLPSDRDRSTFRLPRFRGNGEKRRARWGRSIAASAARSGCLGCRVRHAGPKRPSFPVRARIRLSFVSKLHTAFPAYAGARLDFSRRGRRPLARVLRAPSGPRRGPSGAPGGGPGNPGTSPRTDRWERSPGGEPGSDAPGFRSGPHGSQGHSGLPPLDARPRTHHDGLTACVQTYSPGLPPWRGRLFPRRIRRLHDGRIRRIHNERRRYRLSTPYREPSPGG